MYVCAVYVFDVCVCSETAGVWDLSHRKEALKYSLILPLPPTLSGRTLTGMLSGACAYRHFSQLPKFRTRHPRHDGSVLAWIWLLTCPVPPFRTISQELSL